MKVSSKYRGQYCCEGNARDFAGVEERHSRTGSSIVTNVSGILVCVLNLTDILRINM